MRKVVAYCKRHLAQEGHMKEEKSEEELKQTKSYKSLKNWVCTRLWCLYQFSEHHAFEANV